jgi:hypothetical protein
VHICRTDSWQQASAPEGDPDVPKAKETMEEAKAAMAEKT